VELEAGCESGSATGAPPAHPRDHVFLRLRFPVSLEGGPPALQNRDVFEHAGITCGACGASVRGWCTTCVLCRVALCEACEACGRHPWSREHARARVLGELCMAVGAQLPPGAISTVPGGVVPDPTGQRVVPPPEPQRGGDAARFGAALGPFGTRMLATLAAKSQTQRSGALRDLLVCPLSVAAALSLLAAGKLPHSPVGEALDELLACGPAGADASAWLAVWGASVAPAEAHLLVANSVWLSANVKPSYKQVVAAAFGAHVAPLQGVLPINEWVSSATGGMIPTILTSLDPLVRFVLVTAVYFKATWSTPFRRSNTVLGSFQPLEGAAKPCALMFLELFENGGFLRPNPVVADVHGRGTAVVLPYGRSGRFRAVFVLPEVPGAAALDALLDPPALDALLDVALLPGSSPLVLLYLPRFRAEFGAYDLVPALVDLGLGPAFDELVAPPCLAHFTGRPRQKRARSPATVAPAARTSLQEKL
jgi:serine protease inhibitor